jgi:hypothetical protein
MKTKVDSWVKAGDKWVSVHETEFIDIEQGPFGDVMTFEYEGAEYMSNIYFGSKPG